MSPTVLAPLVHKPIYDVLQVCNSNSVHRVKIISQNQSGKAMYLFFSKEKEATIKYVVLKPMQFSQIYAEGKLQITYIINVWVKVEEVWFLKPVPQPTEMALLKLERSETHVLSVICYGVHGMGRVTHQLCMRLNSDTSIGRVAYVFRAKR